jgi:hypothetical protein
MNRSRERALCRDVLAKRQTAPIANASTNPRINLLSVLPAMLILTANSRLGWHSAH